MTTTLSERAVAEQGQEKFQSYLLSLVFTLLALSVQTAKSGSSTVADYIELAGWGFFLASGIAGLWFMETNPALRMKMVQNHELEELIFELNERQLKGETQIYVVELSSTQAIADRIAGCQDAINVFAPYIQKLEGHQGFKYRIFRYGFVVGLLLIAAARAYPALIGGAKLLTL